MAHSLRHMEGKIFQTWVNTLHVSEDQNYNPVILEVSPGSTLLPFVRGFKWDRA